MKRFDKDDAIAFFGKYAENIAVINDDGVWPTDDCLEMKMDWKFVWELEGPDAPNPNKMASLPIPFTSSELAAFMLDGIGAVLPSIYGGWEDGPYEEMLEELGNNAREAKQAMREAYKRYREAEKIVGKLDRKLETRVSWLNSVFQRKNNQANQRENVFEQGIPDYERSQRRKRAKAASAKWREFSDKAKKRYDDAFSAWRKAMVNELLNPSMHKLGSESLPEKQAKLSSPTPAENIPKRSNWKMRVQAEATARCIRLYRSGANPTVSSIKDDLADWCKKNNVKTDSGIFPSSNYLRMHVLSSKHWKMPSLPQPEPQAEQAEQAEQDVFEQTGKPRK